MSSAEAAVDEAILEKAGDVPRLKEKLDAERAQVLKRRQRLMEDIF
jgi:hypothetical protein